MHKATPTRSRTSICLKNHKNYRKHVQSATMCFIFLYLPRNISMLHIFIKSAIYMRRNVCRSSSKECDNSYQTVTTETSHYIIPKLPSTKFHLNSFRGSRVVTSKADVTTPGPFFNLTFATHDKSGKRCFPRLTS
jgi:hypothetical protein